MSRGYTPKSYIEFLASQYFCREEFSKEMYRTFFSFANPEMISFVNEGPNIGAQNIAKGLGHVLGNVPREIIKIGAKSDLLEEIVGKKKYGDLSSSNQFLVYEYLLERRLHKELEDLILTSINSARTNKHVTPALLLSGDYLIYSRSRNFSLRLVANSFMGLADVQLKDLATTAFGNDYMDSSYIHKLILHRGIRKVAGSNWVFRPFFLAEAGLETAKYGMWCNSYGAIAKKKLVPEVEFSFDDIKKLFDSSVSQNKLELVRKFLTQNSSM